MSTEEKDNLMELEQVQSTTNLTSTTEPIEVEIEPIDELEEEYEEIEEHSSDLPYMITGYRHILSNNREDESANKIKEKAIYGLAKAFSSQRNFEEVLTLLRDCNAFFTLIPKAKTAKIVRSIIDIISTFPDTLDVQIHLCREVVEWCKVEKRTFLRQRIESKLASLLLQQKHPQEAMSLIYPLLRYILKSSLIILHRELKKLDDKQMLTEVHLLESRINHSLQNIPKAKAALTASRTNANSIYVTPLLQAELDEMSGTLSCEEKDNTTGFSYFLEAFEGYDSSKDNRAIKTLKYMCLCKILGGHANEVPSLLAGKHGAKYSNHLSGTRELEAMGAVARAAKKRSLEEFETTVLQYSDLLKSDDLISHHLEVLYDQMLEANLLKIIHPFSCVEISHVAALIKMEIPVIERKLSQMILDRTISGILDQGKGHLILYDQTNEDKSYSKGVEIIQNMTGAVDALTARAKKFSTKSLKANEEKPSNKTEKKE